MANVCTEPRQPADARYVYGKDCTWHAPIAHAAVRVRKVDTTSMADLKPQQIEVEEPVCPGCGGRLMELRSEDEFWAVVRQMAASRPGYEEIMHWSRDLCFPDFDTLENLYRQAMEGQS